MIGCAFTGHRPAKFMFKNNEKHPLCIDIKKQLHSLAKLLVDKKRVTIFYTGGALGVDMWAAETVLELKMIKAYQNIELALILPFEGHNSKWFSSDIVRFRSIEDKADKKLILSPHYHELAYRDRNYYMIDHAKYVIAVYDINTAKRSGTAQTFNYARNKGLPVCLINPDTASISFHFKDAR